MSNLNDIIRPVSPPIGPAQLGQRLINGMLAFRGYNVTNLGRTPELLAHADYGPVMRRWLEEGSEICSTAIGRTVDLVWRVQERREAVLEDYPEAITLIVMAEQAQLEMLLAFHQIDAHVARMACGFSLGEISALVYGGVMSASEALRVPLAMSADCVELADGVALAVLFSRGVELPVDRVWRCCQMVNQLGQGLVGISAQLSPNSLLVMGSSEALNLLSEEVKREFPRGVQLRRNDSRWPPLHTPIIWQRNIRDRSAMMMQTLPGAMVSPKPPVLSLVTGGFHYDGIHTRDILARWIDQPQRLWAAVYESLAMGIELVVHVGPEPNIIPATYERLAANVLAQVRDSRRMRALSTAARRTWLKRLLPKRIALLRAPYVQQLVLEDWLLANPPRGGAVEPASDAAVAS